MIGSTWLQTAVLGGLIWEFSPENSLGTYLQVAVRTGCISLYPFYSTDTKVYKGQTYRRICISPDTQIHGHSPSLVKVDVLNVSKAQKVTRGVPHFSHLLRLHNTLSHVRKLLLSTSFSNILIPFSLRQISKIISEYPSS